MNRSLNQLRAYQDRAIEHMLANPQAGLFLDMGLGKTASALSCIQELINFGCGSTLVVGPIRVIETVWRQEAALWGHTKDLTFSLIRGSKEQRKAALLTKADVYLVNPEHLAEIFEHSEVFENFETLVIDESSMFKNVKTLRFKSLRQNVRRFPRRYILTGTPTPNNLLELWPQIYLLDGGKRLGTSFYRFRDRYFHTVDRYGYKWALNKGAAEAIYAAIADLVLRMDAQDYLELPQVMHNRVEIVLPAKLMDTYKEVEDGAFAKLSESTNITALNVAGALMKCRQIANGVVYTSDTEGNRGVEHLHNEKLNAARSIIEETGSPVIVVYNFQHELELLKKHLSDLGPVVLTDAKDPDSVVKAWNSGEIQVLLLHPASGGHGLNLQHGGSTMVWFGGTFSYEQHAQTCARINRQGQTRPVVIHTIVALNTVDEMIEEAMLRKEQGQTEFFDYLKAYREKN